MPPGIWIQYKGPRARTLQTTKADARSANLQANILDEFQADIEALKLNVPGIPMAEIKIVWGTGQIRAMYGIRGNVRSRALPDDGRGIAPINGRSPPSLRPLIGHYRNSERY